MAERSTFMKKIQKTEEDLIKEYLKVQEVITVYLGVNPLTRTRKPMHVFARFLFIQYCIYNNLYDPTLIAKFLKVDRSNIYHFIAIKYITDHQIRTITANGYERRTQLNGKKYYVIPYEFLGLYGNFRNKYLRKDE